MKKLTRRNFLLSAALALALGSLVLSGCGGGSSPSSGGTGTLRVVMVDAPDPTITAINITINRVEAHVNNNWVPITMVPATFNLLDLVTNEALLGSANLPAGRYNQVRFFPSDASVVDADGVHPVNIPSADQTGIKVNVNYDITPNQITTVLLDFNVGKSLRKLGNGSYQLQPVIPAVVKVLSGAVTGKVNAGGAAVAGADVRAIYTTGSSYLVGTEVNTGFTLADGTFKIWALLPGTYRIEASHTDPATNTLRTAVATDVIVIANQDTSVGALDLE